MSKQMDIPAARPKILMSEKNLCRSKFRKAILM
jgi:hypothetical protein